MTLAEVAVHPLFGIFNGVVGVAGLALAVYFYARSKEKYQISYDVLERILIDAASNRRPFALDRPMIWNDVPVDTLTRSYVLLVNTGNKLIERSDLVEDARIVNSASKGIIESTTVFSDDAGSGVTLTKLSHDEIGLKFNFLRPKEGIVLRFDHSGRPNDLFLALKTKQAGPVRRMTNRFLWLTVVVGAAVVMFFFGSMILLALNPTAQAQLSSGHPYGVFNTVLISLVLGSIVLLLVLLIHSFGMMLFEVIFRKNRRTAVEVFAKIAIDDPRAFSS